MAISSEAYGELRGKFCNLQKQYRTLMLLVEEAYEEGQIPLRSWERTETKKKLDALPEVRVEE